MHRFLALALLLILLGSTVPTRAEQLTKHPSIQEAGQYQAYLPLVTSTALPSSADLIDAAEASGELDPETALIYHVFAAFQDMRLPAQYRGDDSRPSERELVGLLAERFDQLSPEAQATLEPFTIPPYHSGSWWDLRQQGTPAAMAGQADTLLRCGQMGNVNDPLFSQWHYVDSAGGAVRVWWQARYPQDEAKARNYARVVDNIWLKLATLMNRQPPSDEGSTSACRGGDDRLDISLVDLSAGVAGEAWPYTYAPVATPSYLLLKRDADIGVLIHELMHAFQFAYDVAGTFEEYNWWREATASWAIHYIDKDLNFEHGYAPFMLDTPELPLEFHNFKREQHGFARQYGVYLFALYNQLQTGQPDLVRTSWEQFEHFTNSLGAINALLPGGFTKQWPLFSAANWNRPPEDLYARQDKLFFVAKPALQQEIAMDGGGQFNLDIGPNDVAHLATRYYRFTFKDDDARGVTFYNGWTFDLQRAPGGGYMPEPLPAAVREGIKVQALLKIRGQWQTIQDWSERPLSFFCRDRQATRVDEMVLIVSNSRWQDRTHVMKPAGLPPKLAVSNVGCHQWDGTMTTTFTTSDKGWPSFGKRTTVANVSWKAVAWPENTDPLSQMFAAYSFVPTGMLSVEETYERYVQGTEGPVIECGGTAKGQAAIDMGRLLIGPVLFPDTPEARSYEGEGTMDVPMIMPACESSNETYEVGYFRLPEGARLTVDPTGMLITGNWSSDCSDELEECTTSYRWELRAKPEQ